MKRILTIACACILANCANAQQLKSDGSIVNDKGVIIGYMKVNGAVEDSKHNVLGYIKDNGTILDKRREVVAYLKRDGNIEDDHHLFIIRATGNQKEFVLREFFFH